MCDCALYQNCTETPVIPPTPPIPPSGGNCSFTCEDIQMLQFQVENLTFYMQQQADMIDMIISQLQNHTSRIAVLEAEVSASTGGLGSSLSAQLSDIIDAINAVPSTATNATLEYIKNNGIRLGDQWWFGSQYGQLFAFDTKDQSFYKFATGVTKTL